VSDDQDMMTIQQEVVEACAWAEQTSGLMLCLQTFAPWWYDTQGEWLAPSRYLLHRSAFCQSVKQRANERCKEHCRRKIIPKVGEGVVIKEMTCHAGAVELWLPVWRHHQLMVIAQLGQYGSGQRRRGVVLKQVTTSQRDDLQTFGRIFQRWLTGIDRALERACRPVESNRAAQIKHYLAENLKTSPLLKDLAQHLHLSTSRVGHVVREELGMGFSQARERARLDRAQHLLIETNLKISSVASESGFNDVDYFYRRFHRAFGVTPSIYRREHASRDEDWI